MKKWGEAQTGRNTELLCQEVHLLSEATEHKQSHTNTITIAHRFFSRNIPFPHFFCFLSPFCVSPPAPLSCLFFPERAAWRCSLSCPLQTVFVFNWMKRWCIMREEGNMREPKSMSPAAKETSSYLLLTFFSSVFFLLHWNSGSFMFFHAFRAFSYPPLRPVFGVEFPSLTILHTPLPHTQERV